MQSPQSAIRLSIKSETEQLLHFEPVTIDFFADVPVTAATINHGQGEIERSQLCTDPKQKIEADRRRNLGHQMTSDL
jgi:hypothetical protein